MTKQKRLFPVTTVQEARLRTILWAEKAGIFHWQRDVVAYRISGPLNSPALLRALSDLSERHDVLRSGFLLEEEPPRQVVVEPRMPEFLDLTDITDADEREHEVRRLLSEAMMDRIDFDHPPLSRLILIRLAGEQHVLAILYPDLVTLDHWGYKVLIKDLGYLYSMHVAGKQPAGPTGPSFAEYAEWEREQFRIGAWDRSIAYWESRMVDHGPLPVIDFPEIRRRKQVTYEGEVMQVSFSEDATARFAELCQLLKSRNVTGFAVMLASLDVVLAAYSGARSIGVLVPVANRMDPTWWETVGLFANLVVVRVDVNASDSFTDLVSRVQREVFGALDHQNVTFHELIRRMEPDRYGSAWPSHIVYFDYAVEAEDEVDLVLGNVDAEEFRLDSGPIVGTLTLSLVAAMRQPAHLEAGIMYSSECLTAADANQVIRDIEMVMIAAADNPGADVLSLQDVCSDRWPSSLG